MSGCVVSSESHRATGDLLDLLHGTLAQTLIDEISRYTRGEMKDADDNTLPIPTALLAQAIKFLKDNGIDTPAKNNRTLDTLKNELPSFDDDDDSNVVAFKR